MSKLTIDPNALTIGDLEDFEEVTGVSLDEALKPRRVYETDDDGDLILDAAGNKKPVMETDPASKRKRPATEIKVTTKILKALIWISNRKSDPAFTLEDARNVKVTELVIDTGSGDSDDPKES